MTVRPLPYFSNAMRLDADLHLPDGDVAPPYPTVVACSGYLGQKIIHPERFARALTQRGYAVLAFDYRGFGLSEGERGRLVPQEWVEDVRAGVDRLMGVPEVDGDRIALLGWALGGGVAAVEGASDPRVSAVVCINSLVDGRRAVRSMHDQKSWDSLVSRIEADRIHRAAHGRSELTSPWDIIRLNLDERTDQYVGEELYKAPGYGGGVTLESADYILRFTAEDAVRHLAPRPLLIMHGSENGLHKPLEAQSLYDHALEPKQIEFLEGKGHTEWMFDDDPTFKRVMVRVADFLDESLAASQKQLAG
ncbi:hypothetical protein GCM10022383_14600 [Microbacterium soli]|uniref:Serine aminopeptidase S33 domain-containing protein n=2 Tax=Microbacterium soli TaxID=446075 RepID=A0ABP7N7G4_9MICO